MKKYLPVVVFSLVAFCLGLVVTAWTEEPYYKYTNKVYSNHPIEIDSGFLSFGSKGTFNLNAIDGWKSEYDRARKQFNVSIFSSGHKYKVLNCKNPSNCDLVINILNDMVKANSIHITMSKTKSGIFSPETEKVSFVNRREGLKGYKIKPPHPKK